MNNNGVGSDDDSYYDDDSSSYSSSSSEEESSSRPPPPKENRSQSIFGDEEDDMPLAARVEALEQVPSRQKKRSKAAAENNQQDNDWKNTKKKKKKKKNAPMEVSSRYPHMGPPPVARQQVRLYEPRDPRFMATTTKTAAKEDKEWNEFLHERRLEELNTIQKRIKSRRVTGEKGRKMRKKLSTHSHDAEEDEKTYQRLVSQKALYQENQLKDKIQQQQQRGGGYQLKGRALKAKMRQAKWDQLVQHGNVDKALAKRRKKQRTKEKKRAGHFE